MRLEHGARLTQWAWWIASDRRIPGIPAAWLWSLTTASDANAKVVASVKELPLCQPKIGTRSSGLPIRALQRCQDMIALYVA